MKSIGYYNGHIGKLNEISCPIMDRAMYFGDGCYDATMVVNGTIFALNEHLERFYNSCRLLRIPFPFEKEELSRILYRIVEEFDGESGLIYWQSSRGTSLRNHLFPNEEEIKPNLMAYMVEMEPMPKETEVKVITLEDTRFLHCNIKTLNLLPNVLASQRAKEAGCQEVIFHRGDKVTEMAHSNISFLINGTLVYHPFDERILPGIALKHLIRLAGKNGIPIREQELSLVEAMNADELIMTSSAALCTRINEVDGIPVGGKDQEIFQKLQSAVWEEFSEYVKK